MRGDQVANGQDRRREIDDARALIQQALEEAGRKWIPQMAIGAALVEELVSQAAQTEAPAVIAAYLRHVATSLDNMKHAHAATQH